MRSAKVLVAAVAVALAGCAAAPTGSSSASAVPPPKLGQPITEAQLAKWNIDIRTPESQGLPPGKGTVKQGEPLYMTHCAACHGEFGESAGRWPILMGGAGTLSSHDPVKSIGSYWPFASTVRRLRGRTQRGRRSRPKRNSLRSRPSCPSPAGR